MGAQIQLTCLVFQLEIFHPHTSIAFPVFPYMNEVLAICIVPLIDSKEGQIVTPCDFFFLALAYRSPFPQETTSPLFCIICANAGISNVDGYASLWNSKLKHQHLVQLD